MDRCRFCLSFNIAKGHDKFGHLHCRICPYKDSDGDMMLRQHEAAKGDTWMVFCREAGTNVVVQAVHKSSNGSASEMQNASMQKASMQNASPTLNAPGSNQKKRKAWESPEIVVVATKSAAVMNRDLPQPLEVPEDVFRTPSRMVNFYVGRGRDTFVLHARLLLASPSCFRKQLNDSVNLPDENTAIFGLLNEFLYTGRLNHPKRGAEREAMFSRICYLWLLSYKLEMPRALNYAVWVLIKWIDGGCRPAVWVLEDVYEKAPLNSVLRRLVVDFCAWGEGELELSDGASNGMLRDVMKEMKKKGQGKEKSPLLDVRNYYVPENAFVRVAQVQEPGVRIKQEDEGA